MALTYRPCIGFNTTCTKTTWRVNPQYCKTCYERAVRAGAVASSGTGPNRVSGAPRATTPPPSAGTGSAPPPPARPARPRVMRGYAPPPDPKVKALEALAALEDAFKARWAGRPRPAELDTEWTTYTNIKERVIRGSTAGEQDAALGIALQRLARMVWRG